MSAGKLLQDQYVRRVYGQQLPVIHTTQTHTGLKFCPDTFFWYWQLATLSDLDGLCWLVPSTLWHIFNLLDNVVSLEHLAEDDVLAVEPGGDSGGDEELGAIGILSRVCHA